MSRLSTACAATVAAFFLLLTLAGALAAQQLQHCAPRDQVVTRLAEKYGETRTAIGLGSNGAVMETFASAETGTWTITVSAPDGPTCLLASGQGYEALTEALPPQGDPL